MTNKMYISHDRKYVRVNPEFLKHKHFQDSKRLKSPEDFETVRQEWQHFNEMTAYCKEFGKPIYHAEILPDPTRIITGPIAFKLMDSPDTIMLQIRGAFMHPAPYRMYWHMSTNAVDSKGHRLISGSMRNKIHVTRDAYPVLRFIGSVENGIATITIWNEK